MGKKSSGKMQQRDMDKTNGKEKISKENAV